MTQFRKKLAKLLGSSIVCFVLLWCCGVAGAALLALPFRLLVALATP